MEHIPVLAKEVLAGLSLRSGMVICDTTLGLGGHAAMMLEATSPDGFLYGFDRDERNLSSAKDNLKRFAKRTTFFHDSFGNLGNHDLPPLDAILFDLGFSSVHVDDPSRGFSFQNDGPLDMRYDQSQEVTAAMLVNQLSKDELARIIRQFGEETWAHKIANAIFTARKKEKFVTTLQLADIVYKTIGRHGKIHPATKTFQALRIAVNDELGEVERGLQSALELLKPGGRLAVITFHSLEDRIVKQFIKKNFSPLTKKPIIATEGEIEENPRSRSAKLRIGIKP